MIHWCAQNAGGDADSTSILRAKIWSAEGVRPEMLEAVDFRVNFLPKDFSTRRLAGLKFSGFDAGLRQISHAKKSGTL